MVKVNYNKAELIDKIHGCWIGKNIGGTMGAPFEGTHDLLDIKGYTTEKGEPLPNDDLDLQLAWLYALEKVGAKNLDANILADYWMTLIPPHWNEYGIGKANISAGLMPPLCGEYENLWKNSNGAWIRSEVWACLAPGFPNIAAKYAIMDACIDHGYSEGTYAEIFTAVLESMAFFESDIPRLIDKALKFIPEDCLASKSIKEVIDCHKNGKSWKEAREIIAKQNEEIGWFQAPSNLAFTVIGLLYGEGDVKNSLIYAINCGDDTDCTAATCGSVLGIIKGAAAMPKELTEYIGDKIYTISINGTYAARMPKTCTALTERIINKIPEVLAAHAVSAEISDADTLYNSAAAHAVLSGYAKKVENESPLSFEITNCPHTKALIEFNREPSVKSGDKITVKVTLSNLREDSRHYEAEVFLPEGFTADYPKTVFSHYRQDLHHLDGKCVWEMTVTAGEKVESLNKIVVMFSSRDHAAPLLIPITLLG